ncbi:MAG: hypothetical protein MUO58_03985 [Anaerolineales bacterium]|nr:hypothetical protein [Anaerolineales bacterium]
MSKFLQRSRIQWFASLMLLAVLACGGSPAAIQTPSSPPIETDTEPALTREDVVLARRMFTVEVVSFDASQEYGAEFPYSDYVRLRITNGSEVSLPYLTVLTKRFDTTGQMIGSSRAPSIYVADLAPGESAEVDYYPRGHLSGVQTMTVEIESLISPEVEQYFEEIP